MAERDNCKNNERKRIRKKNTERKKMPQEKSMIVSVNNNHANTDLFAQNLYTLY